VTYYRTPALAHTRCHRCSDTIPKGEPMAFRSAKYERDRRILCEDCAAELGIRAQDSKRMMQARQLQIGEFA
jgi:hypothetical protein